MSSNGVDEVVLLGVVEDLLPQGTGLLEVDCRRNTLGKSLRIVILGRTLSDEAEVDVRVTKPQLVLNVLIWLLLVPIVTDHQLEDIR